MMNTRLNLFLACMLATGLIASCHRPTPGVSDSETVQRITFTIPAYEYAAGDEGLETKTSLGEGYAILWADRDTVGIYPDAGSQVYFEITSGTGASSASFDGGGWALKASSAYAAYYPFIGNIYLDRRQIPLSYLSQKQVGSATNHIGPYDFMCASGTSAESGGLNFQFKHMNAIVRFVVSGLPAGTYRRLDITAPSSVFVQKGYYDLMAANPVIVPTINTETLSIDLEDVSLSEGGSFTIFMMMAPVNLNGVTVVVGLTDSEKVERQCTKTPSRAYEAGVIYGLTCSGPWTTVPQSVSFSQQNWDSGQQLQGVCE